MGPGLLMGTHVTVFGTSLDPASRSQVMAREALRCLRARGVSARLIDLRESNLPVYGRLGSHESPPAVELRKEVGRSTHILFAVAIYNWDVCASAKNLLEFLTDNELLGKTVGFLCAAGGKGSYMSVMSFANSLMLDFRCWIVPRFVHAVRDDFEGDTIKSPQVIERIDLLTREMFAREEAVTRPA